jgi:hypothetical protein
MVLYLLLTAAICLVLVFHTKKVLRLVARRRQPQVMDQGLALCILTSGIGIGFIVLLPSNEKCPSQA